MTSSVEASSVASLCLMSRSNKHSLRCDCRYWNIYKELERVRRKDNTVTFYLLRNIHFVFLN